MGNTCKNRVSLTRRTVHPHVCGEHFLTIGVGLRLNGSSPRLWGTPPFIDLWKIFTRFIPTSVGNTHSTTKGMASGSVHPHVCGEHSRPQSNPIVRGGSSPRLWGTLEVTRANTLTPRFIPTSVGNTLARASLARANLVHPHVCGEHDDALKKPSKVCGSSPRLWGTLYSCLF